MGLTLALARGMPSSSAPRWWSRIVRKQLLVAAAIGVLLLAVCAPALADDSAPVVRPAVPPATTALARASIVAGRLDEAPRILGRVVTSDRSEDERATAAEMRAVVDRWVALGGMIAARSAAEAAPLPGSGTAEPTASTVDAGSPAATAPRSSAQSSPWQRKEEASTWGWGECSERESKTPALAPLADASSNW